jgi:hypothetical protein
LPEIIGLWMSSFLVLHILTMLPILNGAYSPSYFNNAAAATVAGLYLS